MHLRRLRLPLRLSQRLPQRLPLPLHRYLPLPLRLPLPLDLSLHLLLPLALPLDLPLPLPLDLRLSSPWTQWSPSPRGQVHWTVSPRVPVLEQSGSSTETTLPWDRSCGATRTTASQACAMQLASGNSRFHESRFTLCCIRRRVSSRVR